MASGDVSFHWTWWLLPPGVVLLNMALALTATWYAARRANGALPEITVDAEYIRYGGSQWARDRVRQAAEAVAGSGAASVEVYDDNPGGSDTGAALREELDRLGVGGDYAWKG